MIHYIAVYGAINYKPSTILVSVNWIRLIRLFVKSIPIYVRHIWLAVILILKEKTTRRIMNKVIYV